MVGDGGGSRHLTRAAAASDGSRGDTTVETTPVGETTPALTRGHDAHDAQSIGCTQERLFADEAPVW